MANEKIIVEDRSMDSLDIMNLGAPKSLDRIVSDLSQHLDDGSPIETVQPVVALIEERCQDILLAIVEKRHVPGEEEPTLAYLSARIKLGDSRLTALGIESHFALPVPRK